MEDDLSKINKKFATYSDDLVRDKDFKALSTTAKMLYLDMKRVAFHTDTIGEPFEYTNTYAKAVLNISKHTYFTARDMLIEKGFIKEVYNGQRTYTGNKYVLCQQKLLDTEI